jgi:hypothetical protein
VKKTRQTKELLDRLIAADALGGLARARRHGHHDDAQGQYGEPDEFKNQSVHGDTSRQATRLVGTGLTGC